ncbi:hypothetical protein CEXT_666721 [Caerostris extrusa]|uniref:Uncharacterized protein n=1 Tax=Caerostris extrusa TaxID=172846 RepID=A0AAV4YB96_CAEEX|nr:hypothetical protein CEXT_666721 [Caerostris extrusa]
MDFKTRNDSDVIPNGGLIMSILHISLKTRIIDSLNFLPMPLQRSRNVLVLKSRGKAHLFLSSFFIFLALNKAKITKRLFLKPDFTVLILRIQQLVKSF